MGSRSLSSTDRVLGGGTAFAFPGAFLVVAVADAATAAPGFGIGALRLLFFVGEGALAVFPVFSADLASAGVAALRVLVARPVVAG